MKNKSRTYHHYQAEDFLSDESFIDWVKDGKSHVNWQEVFQQCPHLIPLADEAKETINQLNFAVQEINKKRTSSLQKEIYKRIGKVDNEGKEANIIALHQRYTQFTPQKNNAWKWVAAAMMGIAISISFLFWKNLQEGKPEMTKVVYATKSAKKGQKLTTRLSDGTIVVLNAGSEIYYEEVFNDTARYVSLKGEAFFDVAKDTRPFRVKSNGTVTTALGTSFNIKQKGDKVSISLITGKVGVNMISKSGMEESTLLEPGEQVAVEVKDQIRFVKGKFDISEVLAWKRGILSFKKVESEVVWEELEKWYGVEITLKNKMVQSQDWDYTGSFDNESLENVLESIGFVKGFEFKINGDQVMIY